jgi:hypothetical protein
MHPVRDDWKRWSRAERILAIGLIVGAVFAPIAPLISVM